MGGAIICGALLVLCGAVFILSCILNWDFFFGMRRVRWTAALMGRTAARIFYGILGVLMTAIGIIGWIISF